MSDRQPSRAECLDRLSDVMLAAALRIAREDAAAMADQQAA